MRAADLFVILAAYYIIAELGFFISFARKTIKFCGGSGARCIKRPLSNQMYIYMYIVKISRYHHKSKDN